MSSPSEIKKGIVIKHQGNLYFVVEFQHVNPGKGSGFTRTKMKNLSSGKVIEMTYRSGETIELADVGFQNMQYLYKTSSNYVFMDMNSFEQVELNADLVGDDAKYLKEGINVVIGLYGEQPINIQLPKKITYKVVEAPPAVKGDTASGNVTKEITLDNGLKVHAPIFIKEGEEIIVNTETGEYCERA